MVSVYRVRRKVVELLPWGVAEARMIDRLLDPHPGERLLEIGSSAGYRVEKYTVKGIEVWGVDKDYKAVDAVQKETRVNLLVADAEKLPFPESYFDRVLSVHLLEHLPHPGDAVAEIARVIKPDGVAVIVVPCERIRGDTAFAGWWRLRNLHLHRFKPADISALLWKHFTIETALFHTLIPGRFRPMPLDKTPLLYYFSQSMLIKLRRLKQVRG